MKRLIFCGSFSQLPCPKQLNIHSPTHLLSFFLFFSCLLRYGRECYSILCELNGLAVRNRKINEIAYVILIVNLFEALHVCGKTIKELIVLMLGSCAIILKHENLCENS